MSPLATLLSRGKEEDASTDVSDLPAPALSVIARVNLLPPEIAEAERFRREQVARGLVVTIAAAAVVFGVVAASGQVTAAQDSVDTANQRSTALKAEVATYAEVPRTALELQTAQNQLVGALGQEIRWSQYLNGFGLVTGNLESQILTMTVDQPIGAATAGSASYTGVPGVAAVTFGGIAKTQKDVSYFLDALAKQKVNLDPNFTTSVKGKDPSSGKDVINFTAAVTVTDAAESGRYSKSGG